MTSFRQYIGEELKNLYSVSEIRTVYFALLEEFTGLDKAKLLAKKDDFLNDEQNERLKKLVARLKNSEPLQYVLGQCRFGGLNFQVNQNVLIPRPETEELVDWIVSIVSTTQKQSIMDIGTGSGCIAVSLKNALPDATVEACDFSDAALQTAQINAKSNHAAVDFLLLDVFSEAFGSIAGKDYSVIVSNPPYICQSEQVQMEQNVLAYEPHSALFVPDDTPLLFYCRIADFALRNLQSGGWLFFEINRSYAGKIAEMLSEKGFTDIEVKKDLSGNDRMIRARLLE